MSQAVAPPGSPAAVALWQQAQRVNARLFAGFPFHSCSVDGHTGAEAFAAFLAPLLWISRPPSLLDIGCGPQPVPAYLAGYPLVLISGIDPMAPTAGAHPFEFVQGCAEALPWYRATFDLVLCATSLDHVLDPFAVLDEVKRVLRPGGHFCLWAGIWSEEVAPRYDPQHPPAQMADTCHVFHLGPWILDELAARFGEPVRLGTGPGGGQFFDYQAPELTDS